MPFSSVSTARTNPINNKSYVIVHPAMGDIASVEEFGKQIFCNEPTLPSRQNRQGRFPSAFVFAQPQAAIKTVNMDFDDTIFETTKSQKLCDRKPRDHVTAYDDDPCKNCSSLYQNVEDSLRHLQQQGKDLSIVTNGSDVWVRTALGPFPAVKKMFGRAIFSPGDYAPSGDLVKPLEFIFHRKPHPQSQLLSAQYHSNTNPQSVAVVGDSWADMESGQRAGMWRVLVHDNPEKFSPLYEEGADLRARNKLAKQLFSFVKEAREMGADAVVLDHGAIGPLIEMASEHVSAPAKE